jgi:hypothetical protein
MAKLGCQIRGTSKIVKKSFGGVAAITDAIGAAVPASTLTSGIKTSAQSQAEKKELEKQEKAEKCLKVECLLEIKKILDLLKLELV